MNNMKKLASILLALVMVFTMTTFAFAADITITNGADESVYSAYKLLNATDGGDGKYAYTLNDKYTAILQGVTGKTEQEDIIEYIAGLNAADIATFAKNVFAAIEAASLGADYTSAGSVFTGVDQGYYLIDESTIDATDKTDTRSLLMLDTAGLDNIEVKTKEDAPTLEKEIVDSSENVYGDTVAIGDTVKFELTGTVSSKYDSYTEYDYTFSDKMVGLDLDVDSIVITVDGVDVTDEFTGTKTVDGFELTANLKNLTGATVTSASEIVITYSAVVADDAVIGEAGNSNEAVLKYENDPNGGDGMGETPAEIVTVYTFQVEVLKTDGSNPLEGAGFTLYKKNGEAWEAVGTELKGDGMTTFTFTGLDQGEYKLEETTVPAGYNKADDVEFTIEATLSNDDLTGLSATPAGSFTVTIADGKLSTTVINQSGSELPSTGGIGTTIFYVSGAVLAIAAVVFLVTKKRMSGEEE